MIQIIINFLFGSLVTYVLYRMIFIKNTVIMVEIDKRAVWRFWWGKYHKCIALGWIAIHQLNCNAEQYMRICKKTIEDYDSDRHLVYKCDECGFEFKSNAYSVFSEDIDCLINDCDGKVHVVDDEED